MSKKKLEVGSILDLRIDAKDPNGRGIGRYGDKVFFVKSAKTRVGATYKFKVTGLDKNKNFGYVELLDERKIFVGNGSLLVS